jgi:hypothetical protein
MVGRRVRRARARAPRRRFTIGINDDVSTRASLRPDVRHRAGRRPCARCSSASARTARSARTRTRSRSSARRKGLHAQGYFVYDSKKSGSQTVSHLRFGPRADPRALPRPAGELRRLPPVRPARRATCSAARRRRDAAAQLRARPDEVWDALPRPVQEQILAKHIALYVIDAGRIARDVGPRGPDQHRAADLLLRHLRRAAARAGDRAIKARSPRPTASAAPRSSSATRPRRPRARRAAPGRGARAGHRHPRAAAGRPADAPEFVRT